jgi:uncharacterized membrane protein
MSVIAALPAYNRVDDWLISLAGIVLFFFIFYPFYILFLRHRHTRRIKSQLVTSMYKLPIEMNPTELAYIFSTKVKRPQMYATLLDLANRSIVLMHSKKGVTTVEMGPKLDRNLRSSEKLLIKQIELKDAPANIEEIINGYTAYGQNTNAKITGSRQYVFWWLLRDTLRKRGLIQANLSKRYAVMLLAFGVVANSIVSIVAVVAFRLLQMIVSGEVDLNRIGENIVSAAVFSLFLIIPMLFVSFGLLKYRGRMLGRHWIVTKKYKRYVGQMDAFREFVRLTHKDELRFESKELKKESIALTRPYAIACGYIKK